MIRQAFLDETLQIPSDGVEFVLHRSLASNANLTSFAELQNSLEAKQK